MKATPIVILLIPAGILWAGFVVVFGWGIALIALAIQLVVVAAILAKRQR